MEVIAHKTKTFNPPQEELWSELERVIPKIAPGSVVAITSKVVAIHQGRCVKKSSVDKDELIASEADWWLPREHTPGNYGTLTIKKNTLITSAGIDSQNSNGYYVLWPENLSEFASQVWQRLSSYHNSDQFGVIIVDSRSVPLRRGSMGICLMHYGFAPIRTYKGKRDLFGKKPRYGLANLADALSASAVLVMGEGDESTPIVGISDIPGIDFTRDEQAMSGGDWSYVVPLEEDIYHYLLSGSAWVRGGGEL